MQADSLPAEPQGKTKNPGVGSLSLLQGIFPIQGSNPGLPHCRRILYQLSHQGSLKLSSLTCTLGHSREPSGPQFPLWYRGAHLRTPTLRLRVKVTSPALPAAGATELPSVHPDSQSEQPVHPLLRSSRACLHHSPFGLLLGAPSPLLCDVGPDRMARHVRPRPQGSVVRGVATSLRSEQGWTPHRAGGAPGIVTLGFQSPSSCVPGFHLLQLRSASSLEPQGGSQEGPGSAGKGSWPSSGGCMCSYKASSSCFGRLSC